MGTCCSGLSLRSSSKVVEKVRNYKKNNKHPLVCVTASQHDRKKEEEQEEEECSLDHQEANPKLTTVVDAIDSKAQPSPKTYVDETSSTMVCSSTTVDCASVERHVYHNRLETTVASSIWPDVSGPTASTRLDHQTYISDIDSEDIFSLAERSASTLNERRLSWLIREREKAEMCEIIWREGEMRRAIIHSAFNALYNIYLCHHREVLTMERQEMLIDFVRERFVLLLHITEGQEITGRCQIEYEWQSIFPIQIEQQQCTESRQNCSWTSNGSGESGPDFPTALLSARAYDKIDIMPEEVPQRERPYSAPYEYVWKQISQRRQQQQQLASMSPTASPPRCQSPSFKGLNERFLVTTTRQIPQVEYKHRLWLEEC